MKPRTLAITAGISYLIIFFAAIFANFFVLESLSNDPLVTIQQDHMIVRFGIVAFIPAPVFSFASRILEPKNLGLGFGILATVSNIGMLFGPYVAGLVRDKTGSYELSFIFLAMLAMLTTITAFMLRIKMRRR